ncbi:MAG: oxidoreductase [Pseudomonadales bacterium]|jgi:NAD(P)-dependent dehydrogenase (short-subunit alcohol dehydrogenase family)
MNTDYSEVDVPDQSGRTFLVTGANTGIGWDASRVLASRNARVLLGCRSQERAEDAINRIRAVNGDSDVAWVPLDLASLASVRSAAEKVAAEPRLDVLINNAGIMMPPLGRTADGVESQFGVNHLGHFALTGLLLEKLNEQDGARIVTVSSHAHRNGRMQWDDINAERGYTSGARYGMSKLANLLFTFELQRRLESAGARAISVACHPGATDTNLGQHLPDAFNLWIKPIIRPFLNASAEGALPTLMAATGTDVVGGEYFGPKGFMEMTRSAKRVQPAANANSAEDARRLWDLSVEMTGVEPVFD